jgi:hypothetical protein
MEEKMDNLLFRKMDPECKKKWLEALRSEWFPQTHGVLFRKNEAYGLPAGYCCLGVLAEACDLPRSMSGNDMVVGGSRTQLEPNVRELVGLTSSAQGQLVRMNDTEKKSFSEIADWIEEYL